MTRMPPRDFAFWAKSQAAIVFVIFLDFHSTKHELPHWLILGLMAFTKIKCIPIVIHLGSCTPLGIHYSTWSKHVGKWRDRRRENTLPVFFFFFFFSWMNTTTQKWSLKLKKPTIFKVTPEEKQQLLDENDAGNIRKELCKSFVQ